MIQTLYLNIHLGPAHIIRNWPSAHNKNLAQRILKRRMCAYNKHAYKNTSLCIYINISLYMILTFNLTQIIFNLQNYLYLDTSSSIKQHINKDMQIIPFLHPPSLRPCELLDVSHILICRTPMMHCGFAAI